MHATMLIIRNDAAEIELYHADDSLVPDNNTLSDNDGHIYKKGDAVYIPFPFFFSDVVFTDVFLSVSFLK